MARCLAPLAPGSAGEAARLGNRLNLSGERFHDDWPFRLDSVFRIGTPEELGEAAVFLCSRRAGFINSVNLTVDGGESV